MDPNRLCSNKVNFEASNFKLLISLRQCSKLCSIQTDFIPLLNAAFVVVIVPPKGSNTYLAFSPCMSNNKLGIASGYGASCSIVFIPFIILKTGDFESIWGKLRCRRHNVIRRVSHKKGGLTYLTRASALMWLLFFKRPRNYLDYKKLCREYGLIMAAIRFEEAWAMAKWLSRDGRYEMKNLFQMMPSL